MAESAFTVMYRDEFIAGFEQRQSLLRQTVTTSVLIKGGTATFLVADSGGVSAVTRGLNGLIPARADNLTQTPITLQEWHDLVRKTGFNVFASQGDQRAIMQMTTMAVINRKIDSDILAALASATNDAGSVTTASLALVLRAWAILGNNDVPMDGNINAVITPAFYAYLMMLPEFTSAEFVNNKPFTDMQTTFRWAGVNFIVHNNLPGAGTASETTYMYHKSAVGHAVATGDIRAEVGYNEEQDYSYARTSVYMGSALLQNAGVVVMTHDGSAFIAT